MQDSDFQNMLLHMPIPMVAIDEDYKISFLNPAAEVILGKKLLGRHFVTALRQPSLIDAVEATFKDKSENKTTYVAKIAKLDIPFEVVCILLEPDQVILIFEDKSTMQNLDQMREDFVANISHELKTPLTSILGFIETLRSTAQDDPKTREEFLKIMQAEASRMDRMVSDLLSLAKVETVERMRPIEIVDLKDLIQKLAQSIDPIIRAFNSKLDLEFSNSISEVVGDYDQLRQVFMNVLENAAKYGGNQGRIKVKIMEPRYESKLRTDVVCISIIDEGPGIHKLHIPRLTERFYRVDDHRSREVGGTGLGLAIVKHIVNRHRGLLIIESKLGVGTNCNILLPIR